MLTSIDARKFPATHPALCVHAAVTEGRGKAKFRVDIVDVDELHEPVVSADAIIEFPGPRATVEFEITFKPVIFPRPGEYRVQLFADDKHLIERSLFLHRVR